MNNWPTKTKDLHVAEQIMEEYASAQQTSNLTLFEITTVGKDKQFDFRLSQWVNTLAAHFFHEYGVNQGNFVLRKIVSHCLTRGTTVH